MSSRSDRGPARRWDLVVLGGGSGGLTAATIAARVGARVLLVDKTRLGGDCLYAGCVPSKALVASARRAHQIRRAPELGLGAAGVHVDVAAVMARIRAVQAEIARRESPAAGVDVAFGGARFVDPHTVRIGEERTERGARFIVATGSHAVAPPIPGLAETGYLDHATLFDLERLPARIAVVGGGPIGVEMGQALARLGSRVTILERADRLIEREEPEISKHVAEVLRREAIEVRTSVAIESIRRDGDHKIVRLDDASEVVVDELLVATGRRPTLDGLGLDAAGVVTNDRGVLVDAELRTSQRHIFAVGDCAGGPQLTHWAEYEARIATRNALFRGSERRSRRIVPWVTFTDPEVAHVGMTEAQARERKGDVHVHRVAFERVDRAWTDGDTGGFAKIIVDRRERLLGAHLVGPAAGEALGEWVLALDHGLRLRDVGRAIHAYPTFGRINRRVSDEAFLDHGLPPWMIRLGARFSPAPLTAQSSDSPPPGRRWATWILGLLLVTQGLGKLLAPTAYVAALSAFDIVPARLLWPVALLWTALEVVSGVGLLVAAGARRVPRWTVAAAATGFAVSLGYAAMTGRAYALGLRIENCTCFGEYLAQRLSAFTLAQDGYMLVYTGWQLAKIRRWTGARIAQRRSATSTP